MAELPKVDPLTTQSQIGDIDPRQPGKVTPTSFLLRQWQLIRQFVNGATENLASLLARVTVLENTDISVTAPITGGGQLKGPPAAIGHANSGVVAGAYTNANITVDAKGHVTVAANGSGGGQWALISSKNFGAGAAAVFDVNNLSVYTNVLVLCIAIQQTGGSSARVVRVSTNNGVSFFATNGDYVGFDVTGVSAATANSGMGLGSNSVSVGPLYGMCLISAINVNGAPKAYQSNQSTGAFVASNSPVDAVRVTSTGGQNFNSGNVYVFAR